MPNVYSCNIPDMMCLNDCGEGVIAELNAIGIPRENISLNISGRLCKITVPDDVSFDSVKEAIEKRFQILEKESNIPVLYGKGLLGISLGVLFTVFSTLGFQLSAPLTLLGLGFSFFLGKETFKSFRFWSLSIDTLFTISTMSMLLVSVFGFFFPALMLKPLFDMVFFTFGTKHLSMALQRYIKNKSTGEETILDRIPAEHRIKIKRGNDQQEVCLKDLKIGDQIRLSGNHYIPVDVSCEEECTVINTIENGDVSQSKLIFKGNSLKQGTRIAPEVVQPRLFSVSKTYQDSFLSKLNDSLHEIDSQEEDERSKKLWKIILIGGVITAIASCLFISWPLALCIVTSICPCSLYLNKSIVTKAVREQGKVKNIKFSGRELTDVVFDFTGTLLEPVPSKVETRLFSEPNETEIDHELRNIIYRIEKEESHIYAVAICRELKESDNQVESELKLKIDRSNHSGIAATMPDAKVTYRIGNENMFPIDGENYKGLVNQYEKKPPSAPCQFIYIEKEEEGKKSLVGYFKITTNLRKDAKEVVEHFQSTNIGKEVHICTGANKELVENTLQAAGITGVNIQADCSSHPDQSKNNKLSFIQGLQKADKGVIFVGDGPNDVPSSMQADVACAIRSVASDSMTEAVSTFSVESLSELKNKIGIVERIYQQAAELKNQNDILSFIFNGLIMLVPMTITALTGIACPPFLGPILMLVPLVAVCCNTACAKLAPATFSSTQSLVSPSSTAHVLSATKGDYTDKPTQSLSEGNKYDTKSTTSLYHKAKKFYPPTDPTLAHSSLIRRRGSAPGG